MTIGSNIKTLRKQRGLRQYQLAERVGSSKSAVAMWEIDSRQLTLRRAIEIAKALDVTLEDLVAEP